MGCSGKRAARPVRCGLGLLILEWKRSSGLLKKSMQHEYSGAIPPTQLVVRSYSAYTRTPGGGPRIPPTAVGGSFISDLALISRKVNPSGELGLV